MPPSDAPPTPGQGFRPKARRPRGLEDRRGPALARERAAIEAISKVYEKWGFEALETPALEYADALGKFLPDQDRPNEGVFAFADDDEQWLSLRYDLTAPLARFVAENYDALPKPYRRWAAGPVWRNEKPGPGRYRQFWQCDADTVGSASPAADAEMIAMACEALEAAGVAPGRYRMRFSHRKLLDGLLAAVEIEPGREAEIRMRVLRAIDKYDRLGIDGVGALLRQGRRDESGDFTAGAGLTEVSAKLVEKFVTGVSGEPTEVLRTLTNLVGGTQQGDAALNDIENIFEVLGSRVLIPHSCHIETSVVRGLEYYTGAVFEAELIAKGSDGKHVSFGSIGGGGRYDDLVARFRGERVPATGFSIGVSRLVAALEAAEGVEAANGPVVILSLEADRMADYFAMAAELRNAGVRAEVYLGAGKFGPQLKYADKRNAPLAIIQGSNEREKSPPVVMIKDLKLGAEMSKSIADNEEWRKGRPAQIEAPRSDLVATVKRMLAGKTK
ncbi:MAG TPA: histidine--tRNA ligase [Caulobacterales bacterium]|nr:histidine--tRNA ligase [Caulobacterales bacterium]